MKCKYCQTETRVVHECNTIQEALALYPRFDKSGNGYIDLFGLGTKLKKLSTIVKSVEVIQLRCANAPITLKLKLLDDVPAELIVMPLIFDEYDR